MRNFTMDASRSCAPKASRPSSIGSRRSCATSARASPMTSSRAPWVNDMEPAGASNPVECAAVPRTHRPPEEFRSMTYCVAMLLDTGLVFLSDSRTSAGVDQISTFRKTSVFQRPGDRVMVLQTAGNLAITQAVTSMLREQIESADARPNLVSVANLFEA